MLSNIRFYVLLISAGVAAAIYIHTTSTISDPDSQRVQLSQYYALTAISYLYIALLATPFTQLFPRIPFRVQYIKARRAIGVSAFLFGLTHAMIAFFFQIGGPANLPLLGGRYLLAVPLGAISLFILFLMASTSFDFMVAKLKYQRWKNLHRLVYIVAVFTIIHAMLIGSHFRDLTQLFPRIFLTLALILAILELRRLYIFLKSKYSG